MVPETPCFPTFSKGGVYFFPASASNTTRIDILKGSNWQCRVPSCIKYVVCSEGVVLLSVQNNRFPLLFFENWCKCEGMLRPKRLGASFINYLHCHLEKVDVRSIDQVQLYQDPDPFINLSHLIGYTQQPRKSRHYDFFVKVQNVSQEKKKLIRHLILLNQTSENSAKIRK